MLNEAPKKPKKRTDYAHPNGWQFFWRTQLEGWRRVMTPALMYFFMGLLLLASQLVELDWLEIVLGVICIAGGIFFNAHLLFHFGSTHYDTFLTGQLLRKREREDGIPASFDHHLEREYRPWKGFFIGALLGLPVLILGILSGALEGTEPAGSRVILAFVLLAGCAVVPITWLRNFVFTPGSLSYFWTIPTILVPIVVSSVFYILGAYANKRKRAEQEAREAAVKAAAEAAREARLHREQTEAQRRKTLQSKKKK